MSTTTRLKMSVSSVARYADNTGNISYEQIALTAVYSPDGANKQWSKWTPSGTLTFTVTNPEVFGKIIPGQFYFLDLVATDKDSM